MTIPASTPDLLCPDCGHHLHRPRPGQCQWYDCPCSSQAAQEKLPGYVAGFRDGRDAERERAAAATPSLPPDWCGLIGSFMGVEQYCGEPSASAWHQPGEWFKHEFVPLTLTPHRMKEADDAE